MQYIRQNDTGLLSVGPAVSITDLSMVTTLTLSAADSAKAKLGDDSVVDISGYTWAATSTMDGEYDLTLQTGITDTCGPMTILIEDASLIVPIRREFFVVEEVVYDALYATSAAGFSATSTITVAEMSQGAPPAAPTEQAILNYLYREIVRNKIVNSTDGVNDFRFIYADDGTTVLYKKSLADASSQVTVGEAQTG